MESAAGEAAPGHSCLVISDSPVAASNDREPGREMGELVSHPYALSFAGVLSPWGQECPNDCVFVHFQWNYEFCWANRCCWDWGVWVERPCTHIQGLVGADTHWLDCTHPLTAQGLILWRCSRSRLKQCSRSKPGQQHCPSWEAVGEANSPASSQTYGCGALGHGPAAYV